MSWLITPQQKTSAGIPWEQLGNRWTPAAITTALWLDAADVATIIATGSEVIQFNDKSGNAKNFTTVSGSRPSTGIETQNGKNVLSLNADFLTSANTSSAWTFLHDSTGSSVFAVCSFGISSNPNTLYGLIGTNGASAGLVGHAIWYDDRVSLSRNNAAISLVGNGTLGQPVCTNVALNAATANEPHIVGVISDPANATEANRSIIRIDGGTELKNNTALSTASTSGPSYTLQIGNVGNGSVPMTGQLAEVVIVPGIVMSLTRERIEGYLAHKWGLTANLPSDHPYKSAAPTL